MLQLDTKNFVLSENYDEIYREISKRMLKNLQKNYESGKLDFSDLYKNNDKEKIDVFVNERKGKYDFIVILWIWWSALGTKAVLEAVKGKYYNDIFSPKLFVCDNVDPYEIYDIAKIIDSKRTLFFVISKSGSTLETVASYSFFSQELKKNNLNLEEHFCFITGENSQLHNRWKKHNIPCFFIPENVWGRFSVLTNVWLLPLAFCWIDIWKLLEWLANYRNIFFDTDVEKNLALKLALTQYFAYKNGKKITVFFPYSVKLKNFWEWYKQLFWESLGKDGMAANLFTSVWVTDQHSDLQLFVEWADDKCIFFLEVENFSKDFSFSQKSDIQFSDLMKLEKYGTELSVTEKEVPNITVSIEKLDEVNVGELIALFEFQIAFLWGLFKMNIYNQPWVEAGKKITKEKIQEKFWEIF